MSRFKKSYGKWAVNRKNQYDCGAGKEGNKGFQPGNTCGGNGDGKDTSADQGGGDEQSEEKSGEVDEIAPTPSKSRPDQPPKNMSKDEEDLYNEPDGEFYVHLIPSAGKFIDGGEFNEREDKSIKRILDIIGRDRLSVSDKGIMFDSLSKYGAEIIRRSLRKAGLGMYADMGGGSDW
jgi:hypothetical protein